MDMNQNREVTEAVEWTDSDWRELHHALTEGRELLGDDRCQSFAYALCRVLGFILGKDLGDARKIGLRAVALCWVVNPALVEGVSLGKLIKVVGLPNVKSMSVLTSEVRRVFGVCNPMQLVRGGKFRADTDGHKATRESNEDDEQADVFTGDALPMAA